MAAVASPGQAGRDDDAGAESDMTSADDESDEEDSEPTSGVVIGEAFDRIEHVERAEQHEQEADVQPGAALHELL